MSSPHAVDPVQAVTHVTGVGYRSRRVVLLLLGILLLSIGDLVATITHLQTIGMEEVNPIARMIIEVTRSAWGLIIYKMATVLICLALLYRLRLHRSGEVAAWCGLVILAVLSIYWGHYTSHTSDPATAHQILQATKSDKWISLVDAGR